MKNIWNIFNVSGIIRSGINAAVLRLLFLLIPSFITAAGNGNAGFKINREVIIIILGTFFVGGIFYFLLVAKKSPLKLKIKGKILLVALSILFLLGTVSFTAYYYMSKIQRMIINITEEDIPLTEYITQIDMKQLELSVIFENMKKNAFKYAYETTLIRADPGGKRDNALESMNMIRALDKRFQENAEGVEDGITKAREICEHVVSVEKNQKVVEEFRKILAVLDEIEQEHEEFEEGIVKSLKLIYDHKFNELEEYDHEIQELEDSLNDKIKVLLLEIERFTQMSAIEAEEAEYVAKQVLLIVSIIAFLAGLLLAFIVGNRIGKPLASVVEALKRISKGNLTGSKFFFETKDEIEDLGNAYFHMLDSLTNFSETLEYIARGDLTAEVRILSSDDQLGSSLLKMKTALNEILSEVTDAAFQVKSGSDQVADSSQSLSLGASEQAAAVEEIAASLRQVTEKTNDNAQDAGKVTQLSRSFTEIADQGNEYMQKLVKAMIKINNTSNEVKKILKTIDDIAFQINLLSLNANIEAARAGKYGKGFAVVADEVRNLARKSSLSVEDTAVVLETSVKNIHAGNDLVATTASYLERIKKDSLKITGLIDNISSASQEQVDSLEQINTGLSQVDQVIQTSTANAEESAGISEELASMADQLKNLIDTFKLMRKSMYIDDDNS